MEVHGSYGLANPGGSRRKKVFRYCITHACARREVGGNAAKFEKAGRLAEAVRIRRVPCANELVEMVLNCGSLPALLPRSTSHPVYSLTIVGKVKIRLRF